MPAVISQRWLGDSAGAFADTAVLFPLLLALAWQTGASTAVMLATTGAAYLATGWWFRLPIPVQPLKSLALMAVTVGATAAELRLAGGLLGAIYLLIGVLPRIGEWAQRVPQPLVHGFQLGLGILLVVTALQLPALDTRSVLLAVAAAVALVAITRRSRWPWLGVIALAGLIWGIATGGAVAPVVVGEGPRAGVVALMVLPQIALTLTNSVLATERAAHAYFGEDARRVTTPRLLGSLGVGNLVVAALGGMPYCHGSGGLTAHYRGGSRSWRSNAVIGAALLGLALWLVLGGGGLPAYPAALQATLLLVIGVFHMQLAAPSWRHPRGRWVLVPMALAALLLQNMAAVLVVGVLALLLVWRLGPRASEGDAC
jgi:hypothetical protein